LVVENVEEVNDGETFVNEALNIPGVVKGTYCTSVPPNVFGGEGFTADGMEGKTFPLNFTTGDERFIPTLGITLKFGRNFSADIPADADRAILNEAALKKIGWHADESVIGKKIKAPGLNDIEFEVIGVVDDFHFWSLQTPIEPMAIFHIRSKIIGAGDDRLVVLRVAGQNTQAWEKTLAGVNILWKKHAGDLSFQYAFVNESFANTFKTQQQFGKALTVMAVLAILIATLGLLGMIIYMLEQRTKEIGIRKVAGASVWNILTLVSKGYTKLIAVAFLIGAPISYWMMQQWLQDFAYRVPISLWLIVGVGMGTLVTAALITSYHSVKAALTNPVVVLRDE